MLTFIKFNFPEIKCYRNFSFSLTSIKLHLTLKSNQNSPKLLQWREKILKLWSNWFQIQNIPPGCWEVSSVLLRHRLGVLGWARLGWCPQSEYFSKEANFPAAINHILTGWSSNKNNTGLTTTTRPGHCKDSFHIIIIHHWTHCKIGLHHQIYIGECLPIVMFCCWIVGYPTLSIL